MAYLELKIALVLILWNFELQSALETLSSYQAVDKLSLVVTPSGLEGTLEN